MGGGNSVDFSTLGLKVVVDKSVTLAAGGILFISPFLTCKKITSSYDLKKLPYEVVQVNDKKTIINFECLLKSINM